MAPSCRTQPWEGGHPGSAVSAVKHSETLNNVFHFLRHVSPSHIVFVHQISDLRQKKSKDLIQTFGHSRTQTADARHSALVAFYFSLLPFVTFVTKQRTLSPE